MTGPDGFLPSCRDAVAAARARFGAAACSIALVDDDELVYVAADGAGAELLVGTRMSIDRGLAGWVVQSGQAMVVADVDTDQRFARDVAEATSYVPRSMIVVPMTTETGPLGVLTILDRDADRAAAADDLQVAAALAERLAAGHSVTVDELAGLLDELRGLGPDQQRRAVGLLRGVLAQLREDG